MSSILVIVTISGLLSNQDMVQFEYMIVTYLGLETLSLFLGIVESTNRFCSLIESSSHRKIIKAVVWLVFALGLLFILVSGFVGILIINPGFFAFAETPYYQSILNPFMSLYYNSYITAASFMDLHFLSKFTKSTHVRLNNLPEGKERSIVSNHIVFVVVCLITSIVAFCINIVAAITNTFTFSNHLNSLTHAYRLGVFVDFGIHIYELLASECIINANVQELEQKGVFGSRDQIQGPARIIKTKTNPDLPQAVRNNSILSLEPVSVGSSQLLVPSSPTR
ncbi:uncharacterized protein BJ171DRAFT_518330 [Polychytrium aggregatum]|uniref:uncharacterized protein n=1 Tax=Polychytrium aggregatum TaxID=110093 RepID=UPI0022FE05B8|nr:uncharacterized protein BJ171DRAFT_518330 [Polychytrium aggregatum]KAI9199419.1 hypothetical protein BJ171DRAFT_518330 [Polychytrium aggregatum]